MEIMQLCENCSSLCVGETFKLSGNRAGLGPMPIQIYSPNKQPFVGTVQLEGTIADEIEINNNTVKWTILSGAIWTIETIDAVFVQVTHIRVNISEYISGSISVRLGY